MTARIRVLLTATCVFIAALLGFSTNAAAGGNEMWNRSDTLQLRAFILTIPERKQACTDSVQDPKYSETAAMLRWAHTDYSDCLIDIIDELATQFYPENAFGQSGVRQKIKEAQFALVEVYEPLFTAPKVCAGPCGSTWARPPLRRLSVQTDEILFQMARRLDYGLLDADRVINSDWIKRYNESGYDNGNSSRDFRR